MTDLVNDSTAQSPKRKFSFRFPHLVHHSSSGGDKDSSSSGNGQHSKGIHGAKMRNFSEEVRNVPDLQVKFLENNNHNITHTLLLMNAHTFIIIM